MNSVFYRNFAIESFYSDAVKCQWKIKKAVLMRETTKEKNGYPDTEKFQWKIKGFLLILHSLTNLYQNRQHVFILFAPKKRWMKYNIKNIVCQIRNLPSGDFKELLVILVHRDQTPLPFEDFISDIKSSQNYKFSYCRSTISSTMQKKELTRRLEYSMRGLSTVIDVSGL